MTSKKKAVGVAVGSAFAAGMALTPMSGATENPFALQSLQGGYMVANSHVQGMCGGMRAGEGKCGMTVLDANKDGKVSKEEFMKAHEDVFEARDANKDGVLSADEMGPPKASLPKASPPKAIEAKCGVGKCGSMMK